MPQTAPTGTLSLAEDYLATTLANVTAFQTFVGAANAAGALTEIYINALPPPDPGPTYTLDELEDYRPFALIGTSQNSGLGFTKDAVSASFNFLGNGVLTLRLVRDVPTGEVGDPSEYERTFKNAVGGIIDGLCQLFGAPGYLAGVSISLDDLMENHEDEWPTVGHVQIADLSVTWNQSQ